MDMNRRSISALLRNSGIIQFYMAVSGVVGMDSAEALQGRSGEGDAGRAADVLHLLHLTYTSLEYTEGTPQAIVKASIFQIAKSSCSLI